MRVISFEMGCASEKCQNNPLFRAMRTRRQSSDAVISPSAEDCFRPHNARKVVLSTPCKATLLLERDDIGLDGVTANLPLVITIGFSHKITIIVIKSRVISFSAFTKYTVRYVKPLISDSCPGPFKVFLAASKLVATCVSFTCINNHIHFSCLLFPFD